MSRLHYGVLAAALVLAAAALSACGSSNSNSADNDQITAAINKAAVSGDPAACTTVQTAAFNAQTSGGNGGQDPTKACEQNAANTAGKSVDVTNIKVDGDKATADAALTGALLDGQTIEIALVKEGGQWKLDKVNSFTSFDRTKFIAAFGAQVAGGAPASVASCVTQKLQSATEAQLQAVLLDPTAGETLFSGC
jgi:hypothetical protein